MEADKKVHAGRIILGLFIAWIGTLFILSNMGLLHVHDIGRYWPVILIVLGLARVAQPHRRSGRGGGFLLIIVGTVFLMSSLDVINLDWRYAWPGFLVLAGLLMAWRGLFWSRPGPDTSADAASQLSAFAVLGGVDRKNTSQEFQGGTATAILGGCNLDLRGASISSGQAVLDCFAMWGGIDIRVPEDWTIEVTAAPLLGGISDSRREPRPNPAKRLVIKGMVMMGGIEVKN